MYKFTPRSSSVVSRTPAARRRADGRAGVRFDSGMPALDVLLNGGFARRGSYLITGQPGSGKTVLAGAVAFARASAGESVLFVSFLTETHERLIGHLRSFRFFDESLLVTRIYFVSAYQTLEQQGLAGVTDLVLSTARARRARHVVVDSLAAVKDLGSSPYALRRFIRELNVGCAMFGCTLFLISSANASGEHVEEAVVDGVLRLDYEPFGLRRTRTIEVVKFRAGPHLTGKHVFEIDSAGITIYPRIESLASLASAAAQGRSGRLLLDIPPLDRMLSGGIPSDTMTAVLGPSGAGKTILGLHFLAAGARRGQQALCFGFYEPPSRLIAKAEGGGLPFGKYVRDGLVRLVRQVPAEESIDVLAYRLLDAVRGHRVRRLFIDSIDGFSVSTLNVQRLPGFFATLANALSVLGVTTLISKEAELLGVPSRGIIPGLSTAFDNVLLLRYVELRAHLHRLISIIKLSRSDYDSVLREFRITRRGLSLAETFGSAEAILSGFARHVSAPAAEVSGRASRSRR